MNHVTCNEDEDDTLSVVGRDHPIQFSRSLKQARDRFSTCTHKQKVANLVQSKDFPFTEKRVFQFVEETHVQKVWYKLFDFFTLPSTT